MQRFILMTTALAFSATMAMAAVTSTDLVSAYQAQGYTKIEVITGLTQIKVEATQGNSKVEVIYDAATGAILSQQNSRAKAGDHGQGVEVSTSPDDFLNGSADDNGNNDNGTDDANDDHGGDGSDDGAGHDANDDHGGDSDTGDHGTGDNGTGDHDKAGNDN